jgi:maleate cis-trans isomerase
MFDDYARNGGCAREVEYQSHLAEVTQDFFTSTGHEWQVTALARQDPAPKNNLESAKTDLGVMKKLIIDATPSETQAVVVACTNWAAASFVEDVEREIGMPVLDSIVVTIWQALQMVGYKGKVEGWGRLLSEDL